MFFMFLLFIWAATVTAAGAATIAMVLRTLAFVSVFVLYVGAATVAGAVVTNLFLFWVSKPRALLDIKYELLIIIISSPLERAAAVVPEDVATAAYVTYFYFSI